MITIQLPLFPELEPGTAATVLIQKGFLPIDDGTCAGTQVEQDKADAVVPISKVAREHKWNINNPYKTMAYITCSCVPVETTESAPSLSGETDRGQA